MYTYTEENEEMGQSLLKASILSVRGVLGLSLPINILQSKKKLKSHHLQSLHIAQTKNTMSNTTPNTQTPTNPTNNQNVAVKQLTKEEVKAVAKFNQKKKDKETIRNENIKKVKNTASTISVEEGKEGGMRVMKEDEIWDGAEYIWRLVCNLSHTEYRTNGEFGKFLSANFVSPSPCC